MNRAIVESHTRGIVTSSTLMANGPAFAEAAEMAKASPRLSVGCHVVLIDGEPMLDASVISTITDSRRFRDGLKTFAARALTGRINARAVESEAMAQIQKIQSAGIAVSHVDTHKHTHIFPQVLRPLLRAARDCGVRALRNPFGPRFPLRSSQLLARPSLWTRVAEVRVLSRLAGQFRRAVDREDHVGRRLQVHSGLRSRELWTKPVSSHCPKHSGWHRGSSFVIPIQRCRSSAAKTRLRESRELELRVLTMPAAREILAREGVQLISYRDLLQKI